MLDRKEWIYRGWAGHFLCSNRCSFRLHTLVGKYKVSTIGAYYMRDIYANPIGDMQQVGLDRHYETMVFVGDDNFSNIDFNCFKHEGTPEESDEKANKMHDEMCVKYARKI
ncbi:MAG: hypothetical protein GY861_18800 [bacterium]|nr:hypothetical protein [bacterium]